MKTRAEIKQQAKLSFQEHYWICVGAAFLCELFLAACAAYTFGMAALILAGPITAGLNFFFTQVFQGNGFTVDIGSPFSVGFSNVGRKIGGYLWMQLFIFLWSLLLFIPGIIKSLSYAMTPYILGDCPNVNARNALKLSMRIMKGHKWALFVFMLSFFGWWLLNAFTFGLLGVFFITPYYDTALAGFYLEAREQALQTGVITLGQLEGDPFD